MNKERLLRLAQAIESHELDIGFNMSWWDSRNVIPGVIHTEDKSGHNCGTTACIGGWARRIWPNEEAHKALGLTYWQERELFYGANLKGGMLGDISQEQAVRVLRHAAETGVIDWSINP